MCLGSVPCSAATGLLLSLQQLGEGSPGWRPTPSTMDSPSPGSVAATTRRAEPGNTKAALAEVLHARPAISPPLVTACPCLLHSPALHC